MTNKRTYFNLFLIVIFGLLIRLTAIDKPDGLWNDEYISWYISTKSTSDGFFQAIFQNCHMPLYYFYLKIWTFLLGNGDVTLRISSVLPSVLSIITMFFVGKEIKNEETGYLCAAFSAMSGFLIYFSQEVRFYSLLFLFSALAILFMMRLAEKQSKANYICFFITNLLVILTHTIGFVFVFFNFLFLFGYLKKQGKISAKVISVLIGLTTLAVLPFMPFLYKTLTGSYISQFWSDFSFTKLFFVVSDYVSPIQINLINTPIHVSTLLIKNGKLNTGYIIFAIIPIFIAFLCFIKALTKSEVKIRLLTLSTLCTLLVMIGASLSGKMVLITKYTTEIYPAFIAVFMAGLFFIRPENIRKILAIVLFGLTFSYLMISDFAPQKLRRQEGHKLVADLVRDAKLSGKDKILLLYYNPNRFGKYLKTDDFTIESVTKYNFQYKVLENPPYQKDVIRNGKEMFYDNFQSGNNEFFQKQIKENIFDKMEKGDKFALITLNSVSFIDEKRMKEVTESSDLYNRMPFLFLMFSHITNSVKADANAELTPIFSETSGKWQIYVWQKN